MGLFDSFKEAMKRGSEAANAHIERERAKQQAAAQPAPAAAAKHAPRKSNLPEGVVMSTLPDDPYVFGDVKMRVTASILTKKRSGEQIDPAVQRQEIKDIAKEILMREIPASGATSGDVKTCLLAGNHIGQILIAELNSRGYEARFKIPLMIRPMQQQQQQ
ncbi:MAG: hypothetical protein IK109_01085 [Clostridiales bacterium]|nr:hypothetical protein [Clostridiales bacterium]